MEFQGAIDDEIGAYGGAIVYLTSSGLLENKCDNDRCPYHAAEKKGAATIEASCWDDNGPLSWIYRTSIPHATFMVMEEGEPYCRGIVFALAEVGSAF